MNKGELKKKENQVKVFVACWQGWEYTHIIGVALELEAAIDLFKSSRPVMNSDKALVLEAPLGSKIANPLNSYDTITEKGYKWHKITL